LEVRLQSTTLWLWLGSLLDSLIQGLQNTRIYGGDYVNCSIQLFLGHSRFPCVRKAAVHSRIAKPHHRDGETDEHLFPLAQALYCMRVTIKGTKVGFLQVTAPLFSVV